VKPGVKLAAFALVLAAAFGGGAAMGAVFEPAPPPKPMEGHDMNNMDADTMDSDSMDNMTEAEHRNMTTTTTTTAPAP